MDKKPIRDIPISAEEAEEFAQAVQDLHDAQALYTQAKESLDSAREGVAAFFPAQSQADFGVKMRAQVTDNRGQLYTAECERPVAEEWDDDALRQVVEGHAGHPGLSDAVAVTYKVDKRKLKRLEQADREAVLKCRVLTPYTRTGNLRSPSVSTTVNGE